MSLVESFTNVLIGYGISVVANATVLPVFGLHPSLIDNFTIGAVFTVISLLRSYALRRLFNGHRAWPKAATITLRCPTRDEFELIVNGRVFSLNELQVKLLAFQTVNVITK